ncbi:MAG: Gfo/Idh/MocA family oxidoreductase [Planctomycetes bacterium]|nr:Gfo/Idh/MocA family oxidoreductase [Planctomycetota bacterium]
MTPELLEPIAPAPPASPLAVAILGSGRMAEVHAASLAANPRFGRLVAVQGRNAAAAKKLAKAHGARATSDLAAVLSDPHVQAVVVATPTLTHRSLVLAALDAGKHVLVEKPLALSTAEAGEIVRAAEAQDRVVMVAHCVRWFHEVQALLGKLEQIGRPRVARASRVAGNPGGWYIDEQQSGGICFDLMVHDFDLLLWWFGAVERVHALATTRDAAHPEMYAQVVLRHTSGVLSYVEGSWLHPDGFATRVELAGAEGLLRFEMPETKPLRFVPLASKRIQKQGAEIPESPFRRSPYELQMEAFLAAALCGAPAPVGARAGFEAVAVAEAARASIASGQPCRPAVYAAPRARKGARS